MKALLRASHKRRLYIIASFVILGFQVAAYLALLVLWGTNTLDKQLFSLSHATLVSQIVSVISQALSISSLAVLTFFAQSVASDRIIRRPQKLAAIQDLLDAWNGVGPSVVSLWRSRRLGKGVWLQVLVVFLFFAASSILQIVVPATVTVESVDSTIPVTLRVTKRPELTDDDFAPLADDNTESNELLIALGSLPNALDGTDPPIGIPPGVDKGIWFNTLASSGPETVTFTDLHAQQPAVRCSSIPRQSGDSYKMEFSYSDSPSPDSPSPDSPSHRLHHNITSLIKPYNRAVANFSNHDLGLPHGLEFGGPKARKSDPPNLRFNGTLLYLPWSFVPDNSTRNIGTIAFVLISLNSFGLGETVNETLNLTVWSWIANDTLSDDENYHAAFQENVSVTFHYWPLGCTMYLEDLTAIVRGDNALLSHSFNDSPSRNSHPFVRAPPPSPYERAWGSLFDAIWRAGVGDADTWTYPPENWLEQQVWQLIIDTGSKPDQKIAALEAGLQRITSVAYSLVVQQLRAGRNFTTSYADVQGQQQAPLAKLHVNGLQTVLGLLCVMVLLFCVSCTAPLGDGLVPQENCRLIVGNILDLMCLMHRSSLPGLLAGSRRHPLAQEIKRRRAEGIDVVFHKFKLDAERAKDWSPGSPPLSENIEGDGDTSAATEKALARLPYIKGNTTQAPHSTPSLRNSLLIIVVSLVSLCCLHAILIVLWARHPLNNHYFDLSKLSTAGQAVAVVSQIFTVVALGLLSYGLQRIAADKFIRQVQTAQDLQDSFWSLLGVAGAFHTMWDGSIDRRKISSSVTQLCFFWLASWILHITMPTVVSVNTATVPMDVPIEVDTVPGNIIDLKANLTLPGTDEWFPEMVTLDGFLTATFALQYIWENRNSSIRLPRGVNETSLFSTSSNISSKYVLTDPYAHRLSVRCGVVPSSAEEGIAFDELEGGAFGIKYQYTRDDGIPTTFITFTPRPSNNVSFPDVLMRSYRMGSATKWDPVSFVYVSQKPDALLFPSDMNYTSPVKHMATSTRPATFIWPLACVLNADQTTAIVLGNGTLESLNISGPAPRTPFPFLSNEPKNQIESNWAPLFSALPATMDRGDGSPVTPNTWVENTMQPMLAERPSISTLEDNLASITALSYALLSQNWRTRYANGDTTLSSRWAPQNATVAGKVPVLKAYLQVNGVPLLVGSLSTLVLVVTSRMCVIGHGITDNTVRDGGVIDLISLLHNSALPGLLVGHEEEGGNQRIGGATLGTHRSRARRVKVAYGYGSLDVPSRIQQRENEYLNDLGRHGSNASNVNSFPSEDIPLIDYQEVRARSQDPLSDAPHQI